MVDKASVIREAQKYLAKGQIDKAIAEWEKLSKESPDGTTFNTIGDLYLKKGDKQPAVDAYHKASKIFREEGFSLKALALYKKILNINPADGDALLALGELNEEKNIATDAIKYYLAAADIFSKENQKAKLLSVYDKILSIAPANLPLRVKISELFSKEGFVHEAAKEYIEIGHIYDQQGDAQNARKYYQKAIEIQPGSRDALVGMGRLYEKAGDLEQAAGYLKKAMETAGADRDLLVDIGRLFLARGSLEEAVSHISQVLQANPSDMDARRLLGDAYIKQGDMEKAWQEYNTVLDEMIFKGNYNDAVNILNAFKEVDPIESSRKLIAIYNQISDADSAVAELLTLAGIFEGSAMPAEALKCYQEALSIRPGNEAARQGAERMQKELGVEPEVLEKSPDEVLTEADIFLRYGLYDEARKLLEELKLKMPENIDLHLKLKTLYADTSDKEQAVSECLVLEKLYARSGDEGKRKAVLDEAFELNPDDPRLAQRGEGVAEKHGAEGGPSTLDDYSEDMSEAEFYFRQGLIPEALDIYRRLLAIFPESEDLKAKITELQGTTEDASHVAGEKQEAVTQEETVSLGEFIMPEVEVPEPEAIKEPELESDVLEIFEEFKKGLAKDLEAEDYETHYNLGIAYKEMGLVDDAIKEFQHARNDPAFFVRASTILGMCYMQKGLYSLAIDAFSSALMKIDPSDETHWSAKYDLAEAYERNGEKDEAMRLYTEVYGWNARFRDVADKISGAQAKSQEAAPRQKPLPQAPPKEKTEKPAEPAGRQADKSKEGYDKIKDKKSRVSYI